MSMPAPPDCCHCPDPAACARVCRDCPCPHCADRRAAQRAVCLECVRWIATLGTLTRAQVQLVAWERGETVEDTRTALLAAYHAQHKENADE